MIYHRGGSVLRYLLLLDHAVDFAAGLRIIIAGHDELAPGLRICMRCRPANDQFRRGETFLRNLEYFILEIERATAGALKTLMID